MSKPIAILVADIHLSHVAPNYRKLEPDWYEAMRRPLRDLASYSEEYEVPVLCAGDVFHKWNSPPKLINFAIEEIPHVFASIPGQHDLPHHRLDAVRDSAYHTLNMSRPTDSNWFKRIKVHYFPWGCSPYQEETELCSRRFNIALLHRFVNYSTESLWSTSKESMVQYIQEEFEGFDLVVCGDHHRHFVIDPPKNTRKDLPKIVNVGQFLCRNRGESKHPNMFLLYDDMDVVQLRYRTNLDSFDEECSDNDNLNPPLTDLGPLLSSLDALTIETRNLEDIIKMLSNAKSRSGASIQLIRSILDERQ